MAAGQVPVIDQSIQLAGDTASYLRALSSGIPSPPKASIHIEVPDRCLSLDFLAFPNPSSGVHAFDLAISYRSHLVATEQGVEKWMDTSSFVEIAELEPTDSEKKRLTMMFTSGRTFDSALPRLVTARTERDSGSGRTRLLLSLTACTYSSVVLDHYPAAEQVNHYLGRRSGTNLVSRGVRTDEFVHGKNVGLLTLSMIVITRDGYMALAQRSGIVGSYENRYGASVNGNMELLARSGIALDRDHFGIPDPKMAFAREAKEELGLIVEPGLVSITGLMRFDAPTERGTNVLLALTNTSLTLDELALQTQYADPVEGTWELGKSILGIRIPGTQAECDEIVSWLVHNEELVPHATAATLAALAASTRFTFALETPSWVGSNRSLSCHLFREVQMGRSLPDGGEL